MSDKTALTVGERAFVRRLTLVVAAGALILTLWVLADVFLLFFGAVLLAVALRTVVSRVAATFGMSYPWALTLVLVALAVVSTLFALSIGPELFGQLNTLADRLPLALASLLRELRIDGILSELQEGFLNSDLTTLAARLLAWSTALLGSLVAALLMVFGAIYLAADPEQYRRGLIKLLPPAVQEAVEAAMDDSAIALRHWLAGQVIAMGLVGAATAAGLWLIGVPSALALGVIAGLLEFIPFIGPLLAAIPILTIAMAQDWSMTISAIMLVVIIQQVEGNLIAPLLLGRMTLIAPAIGLFAVVAMGVAFGPLGLLFGYPLAIVSDAMLRRLYVRETLGEDIVTAGEPATEPSELSIEDA